MPRFPFLFLLLISLFYACQSDKKAIPEPNGHPHILQAGEYVNIQPKVIRLDTFPEAQYVTIESEVITDLKPTYIPKESRYQLMKKEPAFTPDEGTIVFADTARASTVKTSLKKMQVKWPQWTPYRQVYPPRTKLQVEYLGEEHGLRALMNIALPLLEDKRGNIWLGGMRSFYCYTGTGFYEFSQTTGFEEASTRAILEDQRGRIWVAGAGVYIWDGLEFTQLSAIEGLDMNEVNSLLEDSDGNIWMGSNKGIHFWDGVSITNYTQDKGFHLPEITALQQDTSGKIWMGTNQGLYCWDGTNFKHFQESSPLNNKFIVDLLKDASGKIWISTNSGVFAWTGDGFLHYSEEEAGLEFNTNTFLEEDDKGRIWMDTKTWDGKGFYQYTREDGLKFAGGNELFKDRSGNMWINSFLYGTSIIKKGGFEDMTPNHYLNKIEDGISFRFQVDQKNNMWIGSRLGLDIWDGKGFTRLFESKKGLNEIEITTLFEDSKGNMWISGGDRGFPTTISGLWQWDGNKLTQYDAIGRGRGREMVEDSIGNLWMTTSNRMTGESKLYCKDKNGFKLYSKKEGMPQHFAHLALDKYDNIWMGSSRDGLFQWKNQNLYHYSISEGLKSNSIKALTKDKSGNLWIGTWYEGIYRWDGKGFIHFTEKEGFPDNRISKIYQDDLGYIWVGTHSGLVRLNYLEGRVEMAMEIFDKKDGLSGTQIDGLVKDRNSKFWIGSTKGIFRIDYASLLPDTTHPTVSLQNLQLFFDETDWLQVLDSTQNKGEIPTVGPEGYSLAKVSYNAVEPFANMPADPIFPYNYNQIAFSWSGTDWRAPQQLQYSYILEGENDYWSPPTEETQFRYTNLKPGSYTFKVKSVGSSGNWSDTAAYSFQITPPWWQTTWAYLLYILSAFGIIYGFYKYQLGKQLAEAEAIRLKEMDTLKTKLYTNITHEFRTPLTVIQGMADQIEGNREAKQLIRRNSKNLLHLVTQLLDMSKLESSKMELKFIQRNIISYLNYLCQSFQSYADSRNVTLHFKSDLRELMMLYDPEKLQHIIANLLSNALKFTPKNGVVEMKVSTSPQLVNAQHQEWLKIMVQDNGIGILEEHLPFIFDRFYQVDDTHTRRGEGTGIGLALAKELTELMGGTISVESVILEKTIFTILLPIRSTNNSENLSQESIVNYQEEPVLQASLIANDITPLTQELVSTSTLPLLLLIEDNVDVVTYIKTCLQEQYQIQVAYDGQAGIEKALEIIPDIIISDVMMPEKDGFEVTQFLKNDERTSHIPVILLTAKADMPSKMEGLERGADAYLLKPFDKKELLLRLEKLIELRKKLQARYSTFLPLSPTQDKDTQIEDIFLKKIQGILLEKLNDAAFDVPQLCKVIGMSRSQLYRKIKALTNRSIVAYMNSIRLHKGLELLQTTDMTVSVIAYEVGFTDPAYFSRAFSKEFGKAPTKVRS